MDLPRLVLRLGTLAAVGLLVGLVVLAAQHNGPVASTAIRDKAGDPLPVPSAPARLTGMWQGLPVMVFAVPVQLLDGVDAARGAGEATPSIAVPGHPELRLFALSAKSTHLGCTVGWNPNLGASRDIIDYDHDGFNDGRILDPCGQGSWDAFHRAMPVAGPAPRPLPLLGIRIVEGHLEGTGFDS